MLKDYEIESPAFAEGKYGRVFCGYCKKRDETVCLKEISLVNLGWKERQEALNEARLLRSCKHERIISFYDAFIEDSRLYIVMEYGSGGDLATCIQKMKEKSEHFTEEAIWNFAIDLAQGLSYLHTKRVLHRDMKAKNCFLGPDGRLKIGDFGLGRKLHPSDEYFAKTTVGTPLNLSPELCQEQRYNEKTDIWALGCILYELATLRMPFLAKNQLALARKIVQETPAKLPSFYGMELQFLINKCLEKNMTKRPSVFQILDYAPVKRRISTSSNQVVHYDDESDRVREERDALLVQVEQLKAQHNSSLEKMQEVVKALRGETSDLKSQVKFMERVNQQHLVKFHDAVTSAYGTDGKTLIRTCILECKQNVEMSKDDALRKILRCVNTGGSSSKQRRTVALSSSSGNNNQQLKTSKPPLSFIQPPVYSWKKSLKPLSKVSRLKLKKSLPAMFIVFTCKKPLVVSVRVRYEASRVVERLVVECERSDTDKIVLDIPASKTMYRNVCEIRLEVEPASIVTSVEIFNHSCDDSTKENSI